MANLLCSLLAPQFLDILSQAFHTAAYEVALASRLQHRFGHKAVLNRKTFCQQPSDYGIYRLRNIIFRHDSRTQNSVQ
jgi:hypothetical protein